MGLVMNIDFGGGGIGCDDGRFCRGHGEPEEFHDFAFDTGGFMQRTAIVNG